ncbi:flavin reductase family protein [Dellaglioa algida]|uniref:FMN-binding flavin reductase domain protein n=2 Tax=Dellaglioa algida TaxID=105612 RepID=A0A0R1HH59_9LACO|nr:flavin reductase family protein [Dellaglioa algida]KRK45813.1 FMN-binding flavin reductase domain protein [Dellaglioa algida DSM 15638]MDK1716273.1 flavin reductase family protein [Dellaglioa algida]MDK1719554.1 flavin reductase family protein [Dellaglioa algida]MDK1720944.1 flavin reductase family protein [Dellaglioa algida]MDK1722897.1 flavin reductase family protein [Dellaglioa algida]
MISFNSNELSTKNQYKLMSGTLIPRPIAWVTSANEAGLINLAPFSFFSVVSDKLPLMSISINRRKDGVMKHTAANIVKTKQAVVQLPTRELMELVNQSAASFGSDESEVSELGLETVTSNLVSVPGVAGVKARFEVVLNQHVPIMDDGEIISDLFILEVVYFHIEDDILDQDKMYIDAKKLNPVARLAGPEYANIGEKYKLIRPK